MVFNAQIVHTGLTKDGINLNLTFDYKSQQSGAYLPFAFSTEAISAILDLTDSPSWESVNGKYVRLEVEGEGENMKMTKISHILHDNFFINLESEKKDDETETVTE